MWRKNDALFQNATNTKNTRPPRLGASLRSGPRHYMSAYAASLRSVAPGSIFFFYATPGFRGFAAPPPGYFIAPLRGSEFRSLSLAI